MNRTLIAIMTVGLLASGAAVAGSTRSAGDDHSGMAVAVQYGYDRSASVNEREARIKSRIQRGMSDGSLTDREARRLYSELRDIESKERAFRSDGRLDGREAAELNRDLDRIANNLQDQRHDEQRRYYGEQ